MQKESGQYFPNFQKKYERMTACKIMIWFATIHCIFFFHNFIFLFHYPQCFHWKWTKTAFGEWQNSFICLVLNSFTKYYLLMIPQMTLVRVTMSIRTNEQLYFPGSFKYFKMAYEKLHHYKAIQTRATEIVFKNVILAFYLKCILIKMAMSVTRNKRCW